MSDPNKKIRISHITKTEISFSLQNQLDPKQKITKNSPRTPRTNLHKINKSEPDSLKTNSNHHKINKSEPESFKTTANHHTNTKSVPDFRAKAAPPEHNARARRREEEARIFPPFHDDGNTFFPRFRAYTHVKSLLRIKICRSKLVRSDF